MAEVNLLRKYPQSRRKVFARAGRKTEEMRRIARKFAREYFDGDRMYGYGGYRYHPRFWQPVIPDFQEYYGLTAESSVLDVGCGKGFMMYDFTQCIPGIRVEGIDISPYARENAREEVKPFIKLGNARALPYKDKSFDLVVSLNTVHNLPPQECKKALKEIMRVTRKHAFITVDAYRNKKEKERMDAWNLTALTYMHVDEWKELFETVGYTSDYWWFIP